MQILSCEPEQAYYAVADSHVLAPPSGIAYSEDKLLQTRIFSYADTQRHRLGPNYLLLPVNAPRWVDK